MKNLFIAFRSEDTRENLNSSVISDVNAEDKATSGIGIGLANCKILAEAAGGKIDLQSEVNKGTQVTFTFDMVPSNSNKKCKQ